MAGFSTGSSHGQLTINSVALMGPAWKVLNLGALLSLSMRGESVLLPTATGRKPRRRRTDEATVGLEMMVIGDASSSGTAATSHSAKLTQLYNNLVALEAVALPPSTETGHSATLVLPNGTSRTASVFMQNWQVEPDPAFYVARVAFDLIIPAGRFA